MEGNPPVLLIEPIALFRDALLRILQDARLRVVWCCDRPPDSSVVAATSSLPLVSIIGCRVDEADQHVAEIRRFHPNSRVMLLLDRTSHPEILLAAYNSGIDSIILRHECSCETLVHSVKLMASGLSVFPADVVAAMLDTQDPLSEGVAGDPAALRQEDERCVEKTPRQSNQSHRSNALSAREFSVLYHLLEGLPNKEIARRLDIAEATTKGHIKAILRKANVRNRTQIAMWASRHSADVSILGMVPPVRTGPPPNEVK